MFRERAKIFIELDVLLDAILIAFSFILAIVAREAYLHGSVEIVRLFLLFKEYAWILLMSYPFIMVSFFASGMYGPLRFKQFYHVTLAVIRSFLIAVIALAFILFAFKIYYTSRLLLIAFGIIGSVTIILKKFLEISSLHVLRQKGLNVKYIVLFAASNNFKDIIQKINDNPEYGLEVVGLVTAENNGINNIKKEGLGPTVPVYDGINGLEKVLTERVVDYVLFIDYKNIESYVEKGLGICEQHGAEAWLKADFFHMNIAKQEVDDLFGTPVIIFRSSPKFSGAVIIKRFLDIVISLGFFLLALPVFALIAIAIKMESPGPVIFSQKRGGLNGRIFTLYKFRSMTSDAEQRKQELERFNEMSGPVFKLTNDPRVTNVGKFLRRFSLDELPQLINIIKGDMSLVGPRPLIDYEVVKLMGFQRRRLRMRPGLTCLWQIRGRSNVDFTKWIEYDLEYVDNWNLAMDFYILFKTLFVVFAGKGAY